MIPPAAQIATAKTSHVLIATCVKKNWSCLSRAGAAFSSRGNNHCARPNQSVRSAVSSPSQVLDAVIQNSGLSWGAHQIDIGASHLCIWFQDLRFVTPGRGVLPFIYGMCSEGAGPLRSYRLEDGARLPVY